MNKNTNVNFKYINYKKLRKRNNIKIYKNNGVLSAKVAIKEKNIKIQSEKLDSKYVEKMVGIFVTTMLKKSNNFDVNKFKENFNNLKFYVDDLSLDNASGKYDFILNEIVIAQKFSIFHELMHMSSSNFKSNYIRVGFLTINKFGFEEFGRYFNEGCTEMLTHKYFGVAQRCYDTSIAIATEIANIIGEEKLEKLYFQGNLSGLINELKKYNSMDNIISFFNNVDYVESILLNYYLITNKEIKKAKNILNFKISNIIDFLNTCYKNKYSIENIDHKNFVLENFNNAWGVNNE